MTPTARVMSAALATMCLSACNVFDFDTERQVQEVVIPGDAAAAARGERLNSAVIDPQSWNQALPQEPSAIFVERFVLQITDTAKDGSNDVDDFRWLERVTFYAESTRENSTLGRHPVAWAVDPGNVTRIELHTNRALNLVPYLLEGFEVTSVVEGTVPTDDVSLVGTAELGVDAL